MLFYTQRKVSKVELSSIFQKNLDREIFISEYPFFGVDGNTRYYVHFIDEHFASSKYKFQEDAIGLSIATHTFKKQYITVIQRIIHSRRSNEVKLLCIDWFTRFYHDVPQSVFLEINKHGLKKNNSELMKAQCMLNLYLMDDSYPLMEKLNPFLLKKGFNALFYRVINGLNSEVFAERDTESIRESLADPIKASMFLTQNQKAELLNYLLHFNLESAK